MEHIKIKIIDSKNKGLLHDTRGDIQSLTKAINIMILKINEIIDKVNQLDKTK